MLQVDIASLRNARRCLRSDGGSSFSSAFTDYHSRLLYLKAIDNRALPALTHSSAVAFDQWAIFGIVYRTDWQATLASQGILDAMVWGHFIAYDVEYYHAKVQSALDSVAKTIKHSTKRRGQARAKFSDLRTWVAREPGSRDVLGNDLAQVIASASWFDDFNTVRNDILHHGHLTIGFSIDGRPAFQVYEGITQQTVPVILMANSNVIDLRRYIALTLGYTIDLLDKVGQDLLRTLPDQPYPSGFTMSMGLSELTRWLDELIDASLAG